MFGKITSAEKLSIGIENYSIKMILILILIHYSFLFQRNGHWNGVGNYSGGSTTQVTEGSPSGSQSGTKLARFQVLRIKCASLIQFFI